MNSIYHVDNQWNAKLRPLDTLKPLQWGANSSYHIPTNMSGKWGMLEALWYTPYIRESDLFFSLVCRLKKGN